MSNHAFRPSGPRCRIGAVVLNYRTPDLALQATQSVARDLDPTIDRVIVVDNCSADGSADKIRRGLSELALPHVTLVESEKNGGFAAGNNVGIGAVNADAYLLLNSDTIVRPGTASILLETLQAAEHHGIASPRLQFEDDTPQTSCFRQHSPLSELIGGAQTGPLTKWLSKWDVPLGVQSGPAIVPWTSFACVLIRRAVLETVGLLDEGYFMYYEDADYCRMVRDAGYVIVHNPKARVVHLRGKSSPVKEATRLRQPRPTYYYQARNRFFQRAYGPLGAVSANACWTLGHGVARLRELAGHKKPHAVKNEAQDNWSSALVTAISPGSVLDTVRSVREAIAPTWSGGQKVELEKIVWRSSEPPRPPGRLPDFYIIGAMKCATSTLHEQLARRRAFFMSDPKEPNFFSDVSLYESKMIAYQELFQGARDDQIVGESSTHYTKLPTYRDTAMRIARHTPQARLVYVMRDPLARMASQYVHEWTEGQVHCSFSEAVELYPRYLAYSSYARQLRPYLQRFSKEQILPVFFERLVASPTEELQRIARFLGDTSDEPYVWHEEASRTNVSSERLRKSAVRDAMLKFGPSQLIKDALPEKVRHSIKSVWRMDSRPELSEGARRLAKELLDRDLADLGSWLGLPLSVENFASVARDTAPNWIDPEKVAAE